MTVEQWMSALNPSRYKGAGLVIGPVLFFISLALDALSVMTLGIPLLILIMLSILVFIASGLALLTNREKEIGRLRAEISASHQDRPSIRVKAFEEPYGGYAGLEVENTGEVGDFVVQIEVIEGRSSIHGIVRPPLPVYPGCWQQSQSAVTRLAQGHRERLPIVRAEIPRGIMLTTFLFPFFDVRQGHMLEFGTTSWGLMRNDGSIPARFLLKVTITSTPRLIDGPYQRTFLIEGRADRIIQEVANEVAASPA